jgi:hypothetical protein
MNLGITVAPQPLPGKTQPAPKPQLKWVGKDLVRADLEVTLNGKTKRVTTTYRAMGPGQTVSTGTTPGPTDVRAFSPLPAASFVDAVEGASRLAAAHFLNVNVDRKDPAESKVSLAFALLQAADGAWFTTALVEPAKRGWVGGALSVDTGRSNFKVHDVQQLHPAVKAVVGAHSWVNFTTDAIEPTLAG